MAESPGQGPPPDGDPRPIAVHLAEIRRFDHAWGRAFASGVGGERRAIEAEVLARLDAGQGEATELVRAAVAEALEGRRPRW